MPPYSRYISKDFPIEGSFLRLDDAKQAWEQIDGRMRTAVRTEDWPRPRSPSGPR